MPENCMKVSQPNSYEKIVWRIIVVNITIGFTFFSRIGYDTKDEADRIARRDIGDTDYVLLPFYRDSNVYARTHIKNVKTAHGKRYTPPRLEAASESNLERLQLENRRLYKSNAHLRHSLDSEEKKEKPDIDLEKQIKNKILKFLLWAVVIGAAATAGFLIG